VSDSPLCFRVGTLEILIDDLSEDRLIGIGACKQCHRGAQLDRIDAAEDLLGAETSMRSDELGAFDQARSEHGMGEVSLRLSQIVDRVRLGHGTAPQPGDLREDEPHPMTGLAPCAEFSDRVLVGAAAVLSSNETLEVHAPDVSAWRGTS
jgi:hypothetical protein